MRDTLNQDAVVRCPVEDEMSAPDQHPLCAASAAMLCKHFECFDQVRGT
jgi:hypothetical protein